MGVERLSCTSRIDRVVVYARGAVVTRTVELPDGLPLGDLEIVVTGVTPLAEQGSFAAATGLSREVVGVSSSVVLPDEPALPGDLRQRVLDLERKAARLRAVRKLIGDYRGRIAEIPLQPAAGPGRRRRSPKWIHDVIRASDLVMELVADEDAALRALDREIDENDRELIATQLDARQSPSMELLGSSQWTREVLVRLAPATEPMDKLEISYVVSAARWWPAYSARVVDGGASAELSVEAFVSQASSESWEDVGLSLCTADLNRNLQLPELQSLRLGRAQPPRRPTGYRPAPADLDVLFADYDRALESNYPPPQATGGQPAAPPPAAAPFDEYEEVASEAFDEPRTEEVERPRGSMKKKMAVRRRPTPMPKAVASNLVVASGFVSSAHQRASAFAPQSHSEDGVSFGARGPEGIIPANAWNDFDTLVMGDLAGTQRGRLTQRKQTSLANQTVSAITAIEGTAGPVKTRDPRGSRGQFDYRYDAEGIATVPSNAVPERVAVSRGTADSTTSFRVVPSVEEAAYREVHLVNPIDAPLLAGPVDVFVDGALVTTSEIPSVDRGGRVTFGLGVEERIRVARNASSNETAKGLLKGTTLIVTDVSIELTSNLPTEAKLEVVGRIPATDDSDIQVETLSTSPHAEPYDQADRGQPIRGGCKWTVTLPPGGKSTIAHSYALSLPAKYEIEGGNRRD